MRRLAFASLVLAAALYGACSAIDDFNRFSFVDGGAAGDLGGAPSFGQACTDACAPGATVGRPLTCYKMFGSRVVLGGICTRTCTLATGPAACNDYPDAACTTVEGMDLCLPRCDPSLGRNCRTGFACCANRAVVTTAGECAPATSDLCR